MNFDRTHFENCLLPALHSRDEQRAGISGWQQLATGHVKISKSRREAMHMARKLGGTEIDTLFWRKINNTNLVQPVTQKRRAANSEWSMHNFLELFRFEE
eukprot:scaffold2002_cov245-Chaetoceros_neogracile.AAC.4